MTNRAISGFQLDHVVIAVADLDAAIIDYRKLGFTVHPGGVHHGGVSHNALVVFADGSYFELIAYLKPAPDVRWWRVLSKAGEGIVDFALSPRNTVADLAAARGRGLALDGPIDGGRVRPDGVRLDWQIVRPETTDLPFWCGDVTPRSLRVPEGEMRRHANGVTGLKEVVIAASDVAASRARYQALLGSDAEPLSIGEATLRLSGPGDASVRAALASRGEGPITIVLRGPAAATLDVAHAHGARLLIAP